MRSIFILMLSALLLTACGNLDQTVNNAQQAVDAGKQVIDTGKQVIDKGKEIADSEVAQQLKTYLQKKYDSSEKLRKAMFSGDGKLIAKELKNTELADFDFYRSDIFGVQFKGKLMADGTFQVLRYNLNNPKEQPTIVKEFNVVLDSNGQIQVQ
ncbi:hypothetical protein ACQCN2_20960 [Brevibacillus ginsengisoli]|uniref:hypothetical protein n=1 Tax=Brevibacillus ginsengisoli TaxID=363854 RepID=UPI003CFA6A16